VSWTNRLVAAKSVTSSRSAVACPPDAGSDFLSQLNLQIGQHDQRPAPCQRFAQRAADAGGAARDDCHRAREGPQ
jgi:hypothetical protein